MAAAAIPAIGAGIQGVQAIGSGISGKQAQKKLDAQMQRTNELYSGMADMGAGVMDQLGNTMAGLTGGGSQGQRLMDLSSTISDTMVRNAQTSAGQIGQGGGADIARNAVGNQFDFQPVQQNLLQATQTAQDAAARARTMAGDQMALGTQQGMQALDAQLAGRGFSRNSGAAAAGLMGLHQQNALASSQLQGQLADQAGNMALQAAQLDTANLLNQQGMASQYNLGMNQLGANVGMGLQQLNDQQALQRAGLLNDATLAGFNAQQGAYQQNILSPTMQYQSILGGLGGQLAGIAASGLAGNTNLMAGGVQQAGSGKGAALGGLTGEKGGLATLQSAISGKNPAAAASGGAS